MPSYTDRYRREYENRQAPADAKRMRELVTDELNTQMRKRMQDKLMDQLLRQNSPNLEYMMLRSKPHECPEIPKCLEMLKCPELPKCLEIPEHTVLSLPIMADVPRISTNTSDNTSQQIARGTSSHPWSFGIAVIMLFVAGMLPVIVESYNSNNTIKWIFAVKEWQYCESCRSKIRKGVNIMHQAGAKPYQLDCKSMRALVEVILNDGDCVDCYEKAAGGKQDVIADAKRLILLCEKRDQDGRVKKSKGTSEKERERSIGDENHGKKFTCQEQSTAAKSTIDMEEPKGSMKVALSGWTMIDAVDNQFDEIDYDMLEGAESLKA